jgi:mannose-6-phosphate isomerase-like protein (cupin superfamily)
MSDFTVKNLKQDVENAAPKFGIEGLEARFATGALDCAVTGMAYERYEPNARTPFGHKHAEQEEIYVVVGGSGRVKLDDQIVELRPWDAVRVAGDTVRAFDAGADGLELLAFGAPRKGRNDAEMFPGWWMD